MSKTLSKWADALYAAAKQPTLREILMSTRSRIGVANPSGSITHIYCHNDGYISHHAPILLDHYNSLDKAKSLLKLGSLSRLGKQLGEKHDFDTSWREHKDWCCAYGRERGEMDVKASLCKTLKNFIGEEHHYLFKDGQWWYVDSDSLELIDLRVALTTDRLTA